MTSAALKTVLALACALSLFAGGYRTGWTRADAARQVEVAGLESRYAQAVAEAERQARERLETETARANTLAAQLGDAKAKLATQTRDITRRIRNAAKAASGCTFGSEFVGLYNEALGYGGDAMPESAGAGGAGPAGSAAPAAGAGLLSGPVTPEDLLAHARDYGAWARGMRAQLAALAELLKEGR